MRQEAQEDHGMRSRG